MNSLPTKPFARKTFYLDLKGYPNEAKLAQDLKLLGGKQEQFMVKTVSFVVSNRIPVKSHCLSPATPLSSIRSMSPHFFNDCGFDGIESPGYTDSPGQEQNSCIMSRGKSMLQKAREKNMKQVGTSDIIEICKQWNIKVYHIQKMWSYVEKCKCMLYKNHLAEKKHSLKTYTKSNDTVQKIRAPFIKIEDKGRKYKTRYKVFTSWTDIIDSTLSQFVSQLRKNYKMTGDISNSFHLPLKELNQSLCSSQAMLNCSVSLSKVSGYNTGMISNSVSVYIPNEGGKENYSHSTIKRKGKESKKKSKKRYCEICDVQYTDIEAHLEKKSHEKFMNNEEHYKKVQDIILSLPQVDEFLASAQKTELTKERCKDCFSEDVLRSEGECRTDVYDTYLLIEKDEALNCMTELYCIKSDDYISASCSSLESTQFPYLEPLHNASTNRHKKNLVSPTLVCLNPVKEIENVPEKNLFPLENCVEMREQSLINNMVRNIIEKINVELNNVESSSGSGNNIGDEPVEKLNVHIQISNESNLYTLNNKMHTTSNEDIALVINSETVNHNSVLHKLPDANTFSSGNLLNMICDNTKDESCCNFLETTVSIPKISEQYAQYSTCYEPLLTDTNAVKSSLLQDHLNEITKL